MLTIKSVKFDASGIGQGWAKWTTGGHEFEVMFIANPDGTITSMADCSDPSLFRGDEFKAALRDALGASRSAH